MKDILERAPRLWVIEPMFGRQRATVSGDAMGGKVGGKVGRATSSTLWCGQSSGQWAATIAPCDEVSARPHSSVFSFHKKEPFCTNC